MSYKDLMIFARREDILELLKKAFEEGWNGCLDLKDSTTETIVDEFIEKQAEEKKSGISQEMNVDSKFNWTANNITTITPANHYRFSSYYTNSSDGPLFGVEDISEGYIIPRERDMNDAVRNTIQQQLEKS